MFWLFVPDVQSVPETMVLWLNGGPGCSSIVGGVLLENSPVTIGARPAGFCCMDPNDPLQANSDYSWTRATTMLYVEQPTGVGFSTGGDEPQNEYDIGMDMYGFLRNFYTVFPELQPHRLSIFGESYAGYYVPAIARRIALENDRIRNHFNKNPKSDTASDSLLVNLDGIGIGNGWMDATVQGPAVIDYAWWHGMIDAYTRDYFHEEWEHCYGATLQHDSSSKQTEPKPFHGFTTPDECGIMEAVLLAAGKGVLPDGEAPNTYDVTTFDPYAIILPTNSTFHRFMNNPLVKKALHAPQDVEWYGCIPGAGRRRRRRQLGLLDHDEPISVVPYVAELLDRWNVRVLVYNGDFDMSVNAQGSELLLNKMEWTGKKAWEVAGRAIWMTKSEGVAGYAKQIADLTFIVVKNSGHLVPFNQPKQALDLVERFLQDSSFQDIPLPSFVLSSRQSRVKSFDSQEQLLYVSHKTSTRQHSCQGWILAQCIGGIACFLAGVIVSQSWKRHGYDAV